MAVVWTIDVFGDHQFTNSAPPGTDVEVSNSIFHQGQGALTMHQVAEVTGVSIGWACQLRTRFIREGKLNAPSRRVTGEKPKRQQLSRDEEAKFLAPFLEPAQTGGIVVVRAIKPALEARLGRPVALATIYNLLHRHGWRKLAPGSLVPEVQETM